MNGRYPFGALLTALVFSGCGNGTGPTPISADAAGFADAGYCDQGIKLGRCQVEGTGANCTGFPEEVPLFVPLSDGDSVAIVTGPQGATMFVFAVQAAGINPTEPLIELNIFRTSYSVVARYRGRAEMSPDSNAGELFVVNDLFVVIDAEAPVQSGHSLTARANLRDEAGTERCGTLSFTVE